MKSFFWNGMSLDVYSRGFGDAEAMLGDREPGDASLSYNAGIRATTA